MGFRRRVVDAGGVALETFTAGAGAPAICTAHGFMPATATGGLMAGPLSAISETTAVNLRSMGGSDGGEGAELSLRQAVDDLEAVRIALGHDRWVFAGGSAGGMLGLLYALAFPGSLEALILVGTAASHRAILDASSVYHPDHPDNAKLVGAEMHPAEGSPSWPEVVWPLLSLIDEPVIDAARQAGQISAARFLALSAEMPQFDLEPRLGDIDVPTLVIHGRYDTPMPVREAEIMGERIPGAELSIIENSGHFPYWETPADFESAVRRFLDRTITR